MDSQSVADMSDYTLYLGAESYEAFRSAFIKDAEELANENLKCKKQIN